MSAVEQSAETRDLVELRDYVKRAVTRDRKLRQMAALVGFTPEDVASEALARYLGASRNEPIDNPAGWMLTAARNLVYSLHRKGLPRERPWPPRSRKFVQMGSREQAPVDERVERGYEDKLYDAAVQRLSARDQQAIAAFEHAGSMRAVEKRYGIPKSNVQRAFKRLQQVITSESGHEAGRRARSRALAYHLGYMSPRQKEDVKARLQWDTNLVKELRGLELGGRRIAALIPPGGIAVPPVQSFAERGQMAVEKLRESAIGLVSRHGSDAETATGAAGLGGAGVAAKTAVLLCAGAAAGTSCVVTGVVPAPDLSQGKAPEDETTLTQPVTTTPAPAPAPDASAQQVTAPAVETVKEQTQQQFGVASAPSSSGETREFGGPVTSGGSTSGGGGSSGGKSSFGFGK